MSISVSLAIIFVLICALLYVLHRWYTSEDKLKISERRLQQKSIKLTDVAEALGLPNSDELPQEIAGRQQEIVDAFNNSSRGDLVMSGTALPGRVVVSSRNAVIPATVSAVRDLLESTVTGNGKLVD